MSHFSIGQLAEPERPREKLIQLGRQSLSDAELLAIIIRNGSTGQSALELSRNILASVNHDLGGLSRMEIHDLARFKGVGKVKAITIVASIELGRRRLLAEASRKEKITSSEDAAAIFLPLLSDLQHEEFWIMLLNRANHVISKIQISKGGVAGTVADPKLIFKKAVELSASGIILCHNHPSGNSAPSDADRQLTKKMTEAGRLLDIRVLDHLIIAGNNYLSFSDEGEM